MLYIQGEKMIGIYKITNKINGKFYIGQSVNIERRFTEHRNPHGKETSLKLAIKKYGKENFLFEVIEECTIQDLDEREVYWIARLQPQYNRTAGGTGVRGHTVPEETRQLLSKKCRRYWDSLPEAQKQEICNRLTGPPKGHPVSQETREKLRSANLGKVQSTETVDRRKETIIKKKAAGYVQTNAGHKKKVRCIETNQIFDSVKSAGESLSVHPSCITGVLKGRYKTCKGMHFEYVV